MTKTDLPYDDPLYASGHDLVYHADPANAVHSRFELGMVAELARARPGLSWLDVACGTGFHLANAGGHMRRTGVDRSEAMLEVARRRPGHAATFHCRDARDLSGLGRFDLVTSFWYGYVHQESVDEVLRLLSSMAGAVAPGGDLLLGICDPASGLRKMPRAVDLPFGPGTMRIDAVVWSYSEGGKHEYRNCIAPHPELILETLAPRFEAHRWRDYPRSAARPRWQRGALHLRRPTSRETQ
ncbi:MAG: class I SAM-dependent methyltransferase [Boseongicola sp.]|nr:class I SAM-dependent methyltransferase [Boseongicola sp.]MXY16351.1 class I SAM-dependent methyltransferase [Acidobacteriota bacterium]MYE12221.1 class I SAM-dependent methyltransferase [Gammaproteobacteria bacterium]